MFQYSGNGGITIQVPAYNAVYFNHMLKSNSIAPLAALFRKAGNPAKEYTESCSALSKLDKWHNSPTNVLHVGDGAHARTAALFAFHTKHNNYSIDPALSKSSVANDWQAEYAVQRLSLMPSTIEEFLQSPPNFLFDGPPLLLTFVHAHVDTEKVLADLPKGSWKAAYTCSCCEPETQLVPRESTVARIVKEGEDWGVLSRERTFQVLVPR